MPNFSSEHLLYTFHGSLPGGESWSFGLRTQAATPTVDQMQPLADWAAESLERVLTTPLLGQTFNSGTIYTGVTLRKLNVAGLTEMLAEAAPVDGPKAGTGNQPLPNQCAMAVTLLTALAGRHGKGRVYWPATALNVNPADGRIGVNATQPIADAFALMIQNISGQPEGRSETGMTRTKPTALYRIAVQSRTPGFGPSVVTRVACGNVMDTIRGRRKGLKESYAYTAVETPEI